MTSKRVLVEDIIFDLVYFAMFYGIFAMVGNALWLVIPFLCNRFARNYIKNIFFMLIAHLLIVGAFFLLVNDLLILAFLIVAFVYSIYQRVRGERVLSRFGCIFMAIALIAAYFAGPNLRSAIELVLEPRQMVALLYPILVMVVIIGCELHTRMRMVDQSLELVTKTSTQPVNQILRFDRNLMPVLAVIMVILSLAMYFAVTNHISEIRIARPELYIGEAAPDMGIPVITAPNPTTPDFRGMFEYSEPSFIMVLLETILLFIMRIVGIVGPVVLIVWLLFKLYRGLAYKHTPHSFEGDEDEKMFILPEKIKAGIINPFEFFRWNENKTRKMFRKKVQRYIKMGVPISPSDTPVQIAGMVKAEDISALVGEYERVRYKRVQMEK